MVVINHQVVSFIVTLGSSLHCVNFPYYRCQRRSPHQQNKKNTNRVTVRRPLISVFGFIEVQRWSVNTIKYCLLVLYNNDGNFLNSTNLRRADVLSDRGLQPHIRFHFPITILLIPLTKGSKYEELKVVFKILQGGIEKTHIVNMCIKRERGGGKKEHTQGLHSSFREDDKGQVRSSSTTSSMHQYSSRTTTGKIYSEN